MENIIIENGLFYDGSTKLELEVIKSLYPNNDIHIHWITVGMAHITVY